MSSCAHLLCDFVSQGLSEWPGAIKPRPFQEPPFFDFGFEVCPYPDNASIPNQCWIKKTA